jgi:hypothetical protein
MGKNEPPILHRERIEELFDYAVGLTLSFERGAVVVPLVDRLPSIRLLKVCDASCTSLSLIVGTPQ